MASGKSQSTQLEDALTSPDAPTVLSGLMKRIQGIQAEIDEGYKSRENGDDVKAREILSRVENTHNIPLVIRASNSALKTNGQIDTVLRAAVDVICARNNANSNNIDKKKKKLLAEEALEKEREALSAERTRCAMICEVLSAERDKIVEERRQLSTDRALTISYMGKLKELDEERKKMAEEHRKNVAATVAKNMDDKVRKLEISTVIEQQNLKKLIEQDMADRKSAMTEIKKDIQPLKDIASTFAEAVNHLQQSVAHVRMQIASSASRNVNATISHDGNNGNNNTKNESSQKQPKSPADCELQAQKQRQHQPRRQRRHSRTTSVPPPSASPPVVSEVPGTVVEVGGEPVAEFEPISISQSKSSPRRKARVSSISGSARTQRNSNSNSNNNNNSIPKKDDGNGNKKSEVTERALVIHGTKKPRRRLSELQKLQASLATAQWVDSRKVAKIKEKHNDYSNGTSSNALAITAGVPPAVSESTRKRVRIASTSEDGRKKKKK